MTKQKIKEKLDNFSDNGGLFMLIIFGGVGILCVIIGFLGNMLPS